MPLTAFQTPVQDHATNKLSVKTEQGALILGIESSCDETAAAVVERRANSDIFLHASVIATQIEAHTPFGGVVPEIAARAHMEKIDHIIDQAMHQSGFEYRDLSAVAVTSGPGLIGGVITGLLGAKGLALALDIPLIGVNHLEGHALSPRLEGHCPFPYLLLLVSGGHTQLLAVKGLGDYHRLGSTVDDALGEAFDKTAKVMDLGFPGGPYVEAMAKSGNADAVSLPRPFFGKDHANFSFAGLKTAVSRAYDHSDKSMQSKADLAASFQKAACEVLIDRTQKAMDMFIKLTPKPPSSQPRFVIAGGVAANQTLRQAFESLCEQRGFSLHVPPLQFCTDNGAMIALTGAEYYAQGNYLDLKEGLAIPARPRWPLDANSAISNPASGSGRKGPRS